MVFGKGSQKGYVPPTTFKKGHRAPPTAFKKGMPSLRKGKKLSEETKRKISLANKDKTPWNKGKTGVYSKETLQKISEALTGEKHPMYGNHHSEETKKKIGQSNKGHIHTEEFCRNISLRQKGKKHSEETKRKMGLAHKGRPTSEETKRKIGLANRNNGGNRGKERHQNLISKIASLLDNGKNKVEIEKSVKVNSNRWRIIDILVNDNVCIEIGDCRKEKIDDLKNNSFKVLHLPYTLLGGL